MRERIDTLVNEIPNKEHILQLVEKLDLSLKIEAESGTYYLLFREGKVDCCQSSMHTGFAATISGKDAHFEQLFNGDLKLRQGVKMNYFTIDCPFRAQLILESLFYLARPLPV